MQNRNGHNILYEAKNSKTENDPHKNAALQFMYLSDLITSIKQSKQIADEDKTAFENLMNENNKIGRNEYENGNDGEFWKVCAELTEKNKEILDDAKYTNQIHAYLSELKKKGGLTKEELAQVKNIFSTALPAAFPRKGSVILDEVIQDPADPRHDQALQLHHLYRLITNMSDAMGKDESNKTLRQTLKSMKITLNASLHNYNNADELLDEKSRYINETIRLLNQTEYTNYINDYLKALDKNNEAIRVLQKTLPIPSKNVKYKSGIAIINEARVLDELNDNKTKALLITYSLDWIEYIKNKIPDPERSLLDELHTKLNTVLSGKDRSYLSMEDVWIDCQSILNKSKEILNHPKYADQFENYQKSAEYQNSLVTNKVNANQMIGILNQVRPPTPLGEILFNKDNRTGYLNQFKSCMKAIDDFNIYRSKTKKHIITDLIHRSRGDKKSKSAKIERSNIYAHLLKELTNEEFTCIKLISSDSPPPTEQGVLFLRKTTNGEIYVDTSSESKILTRLTMNEQNEQIEKDLLASLSTSSNTNNTKIEFPAIGNIKELNRRDYSDKNFDNIITSLGYTQTNELKRLVALQDLTQSAHDHMNKSGKRSRFKKVLEVNIQPMLNKLKKDLEDKDNKSELHLQTLQKLNEIQYMNPRKEFAHRLRQYIDTINMSAMPNMQYIENANRLFTHLLSPKKKDELCIYLEGIYNDIMNGKITSSYFTEAQNQVANKWQNNPQAIKILAELQRDFDAKVSISKNDCGFTNTQPSNTQPYRPTPPTEQTTKESLQGKKAYLEHSISRSFYFLNMAHGVGSTGMFAENKRGYGQAADFIASIDTSALNAVAPGVSILQAGVVFGLNKMDEHERNNERSNSTAIQYDKIDEIGKALARLITDRFSCQLQSMYFSPTYTQTLDTLADYAVRYTLTNLKDVPNYQASLNKANGPEDVAAVLLKSMLVPTFHIHTPSVIPLNPLRAKLDHVDDVGIFKKKQDWTVNGLFQKTGYVVVGEKGDLTFYKPEGANTEKYGYAFVSADQIPPGCKTETPKSSIVNKYRDSRPDSLIPKETDIETVSPHH